MDIAEDTGFTLQKGLRKNTETARIGRGYMYMYIQGGTLSTIIIGTSSQYSKINYTQLTESFIEKL